MSEVKYLILLGLFIIAKLVGLIKNKGIRNIIIIIVDALALVVFVIFFSLWEKILFLVYIFIMSIVWIAGINRFKGFTKTIDLKESDIPGLLVWLGNTIIYFAFILR